MGRCSSRPTSWTATAGNCGSPRSSDSRRPRAASVSDRTNQQHFMNKHKRKRTRRFERLENRVLPSFSTEVLALLGTNDASPQFPFVAVNGTTFFRANDGI